MPIVRSGRRGRHFTRPDEAGNRFDRRGRTPKPASVQRERTTKCSILRLLRIPDEPDHFLEKSITSGHSQEIRQGFDSDILKAERGPIPLQNGLQFFGAELIRCDADAHSAMGCKVEQTASGVLAAS
jgi:hypothetical protein